MMSTDLKERIIRNAPVASALNRFIEERVFGVDNTGLIGVISVGNGVEKPDEEVQDLMNGILGVLGLKEVN